MPKLAIDCAGNITAIWSDELVGLVDQGDGMVSRASYVEPDDDNRWTVTMVTTYHGDNEETGLRLPGVYRRRGDALAAEVAYLDRKLFSLTDER